MNTGFWLAPLPNPAARQVEVVERKGLGHPDTICDAVAEELSRSLCRFYRDRFGLILHHNVDKVLLWGGAARPALGGGQVLAPLEIFLCGRATSEFGGVTVPVAEMAVEGTRDWLRRHLRHLDPDRDVRIHCLVRPGSPDLVDLFVRQQATGDWLANDTSIGVGYAPLSALEKTVLGIERGLNSDGQRRGWPGLGEDIKVLGVRTDETIDLTLSCAMVGRHLAALSDYLALKSDVAAAAAAMASAVAAVPVNVTVNAADDPARGAIYLTVSGTSAEAGDDGEAGRGNRANGLITPHRPMTMESVAGKNPVNHVGKLYNVAAREIAKALVEGIPGIVATECYLVSRIGHPIRDPQLVEIRICDADNRPVAHRQTEVREIVQDHLDKLGSAWQRYLAGDAFSVA